jgi:hypothetical protein
MRTKVTVFAFLLTAVVLGAGIAVAVVPNGNTFNACRNKTTFAIRIIDPSLGQKCTTNETAISWRTWHWRGAWNSATAYVIADAVSSGGQSYTAVANSTNKPPATNPTVWNLLAAKGAPGVVTGLGTATGTATAGTGGGTCTMSEIQLIAGNQYPAGTTPAKGQILLIATNTELFSLIGTTYGGNGTNDFALPNMQNVAPNHMTYVICISGLYP